jgi:hypothetical protein
MVKKKTVSKDSVQNGREKMTFSFEISGLQALYRSTALKTLRKAT